MGYAYNARWFNFKKGKKFPDAVVRGGAAVLAPPLPLRPASAVCRVPQLGGRRCSCPGSHVRIRSITFPLYRKSSVHKTRKCKIACLPSNGLERARDAYSGAVKIIPRSAGGGGRISEKHRSQGPRWWSISSVVA